MSFMADPWTDHRLIAVAMEPIKEIVSTMSFSAHDNDDDHRRGDYNKHEWVISAHILKLQAGLLAVAACLRNYVAAASDWLNN